MRVIKQGNRFLLLLKKCSFFCSIQKNIFQQIVLFLQIKKILIKIGLEDIKCVSKIGLLDNERKNGNIFKVNTIVWFKTKNRFQNDLLSDTYDYSDLYQIVKDEMSIPTKLIEKVAFKIIDKVAKSDKRIKKIKIKIQKMNPPLSGDIASSFVEITEKIN